MAPLNLAYLFQRVTWSTNRAMRGAVRHLGVLGVALGGILIVIMMLLIFLVGQSRQISRLKVPQNSVVDWKMQEPAGAVTIASELAEFQRDLLSYGDIPNTLRDLIILAQSNNLVLSRGEYQTQFDTRGKFLRFQMVLPVRGEALAVERFILEALAQHKTIALESVQFKREGRSSRELEAKVQWVLLTQLPGDAGTAR